jgi:hypothetical protein
MRLQEHGDPQVHALIERKRPGLLALLKDFFDGSWRLAGEFLGVVRRIGFGGVSADGYQRTSDDSHGGENGSRFAPWICAHEFSFRRFVQWNVTSTHMVS